jgi:hypothetical protein
VTGASGSYKIGTATGGHYWYLDTGLTAATPFTPTGVMNLTATGLRVGDATAAAYPLHVVKAGTSGANLDIAAFTNGVDADAVDTTTSILLRQVYSGTTADDLVAIVGGTEGDWTATASTRDSYLALKVSLDGNLVERMRLGSGSAYITGISSFSIKDNSDNTRIAFTTSSHPSVEINGSSIDSNFWVNSATRKTFGIDAGLSHAGFYDASGEAAWWDTEASILLFADNKYLGFGNTDTTPDGKIYSDGTYLRINGSFMPNAGVNVGDVYVDCLGYLKVKLS